MTKKTKKRMTKSEWQKLYDNWKKSIVSSMKKP